MCTNIHKLILFFYTRCESVSRFIITQKYIHRCCYKLNATDDKRNDEKQKKGSLEEKVFLGGYIHTYIRKMFYFASKPIHLILFQILKTIFFNNIAERETLQKKRSWFYELFSIRVVVCIIRVYLVQNTFTFFIYEKI